MKSSTSRLYYLENLRGNYLIKKFNQSCFVKFSNLKYKSQLFWKIVREKDQKDKKKIKCI